MSSPVQLSDLDLATTADDADLALIRKSNTTDYKVLVSALRNIAVDLLPSLPVTAQVNDYMLINQASQNCKIEFGKVGFISGTKMWFYAGAAPTYWTVVPNTGDTLLAVRGGATYTTGGVSNSGTWTQANHTLTISQIPAHTHTITKTKDSTGSSNNLGPLRGKRTEDDANPDLRICTSNSTGGGGSHNHGSTWRPLASVGIICQKN